MQTLHSAPAVPNLSKPAVNCQHADFDVEYLACTKSVVWRMYEGRSINKLENGAIPLILKIEKIRNIRFVGNLILKIHIIF